MALDILSIVRSVATAFEAFQAVEALAEQIGDSLSSNDQAELKAKLAELRVRNDAARAARHRQLTEAAKR